MNLDDRARAARASLHHHVSTDLDIGEARASLEARGRRQRSDRRRARVAAAGISAMALLGLGLVVSTGSGGPAERDPGEVAIDDSGRDTASDEAMIEAMPLGPTDGKESWRLPVAAAPQSGLREGDTITIYGRGFEPYDSLGVVHCGSEADTENAGVNGCDLAGGGSEGGFAGVQYVDADENGDVVADIVVRRFIETPGHGRIDCASAPERCLIGMGAISNYDRSGGVYINFTGAPEFPLPTFTVAPDPTQLTPGQEVQVDVAQWVPGRQIRIQQCILGDGGLDGSQRCEPLLDTRADANGAFSGTVVVNAEVVDDAGAEPCAGNCVLQATGIGIPEGTTAPFPDVVAIDFIAGAESDATTTTHAGTTTTPPPVDGNPANPTTTNSDPVTGPDPEGAATTTTVVVNPNPVDPANPTTETTAGP